MELVHVVTLGGLFLILVGCFILRVKKWPEQVYSLVMLIIATVGGLSFGIGLLLVLLDWISRG